MTGKESLAKETTARAASMRSGRGLCPILLVLLIAFTLRMSLFGTMSSHPERFLQVDSSKYYPVAMNLLQFGRFGSLDATGEWVPDVDRTPIYTTFLAVVYAAFGPFSEPAMIIQALISTLTIAIAYRLGRLWVGRRAGLIVALLMSVEVGGILYANQVMTETLFGLGLVGSLAIWSVMVRQKRWRYGFLSGAALGLTTLIRPITVYFGTVMGFLSLLVYRGRKRDRLLAALSVVLTFILVITPWLARNYAIMGQAQLSTVQGNTLLFFNVRQLRAYQQGISIEEAEAQLLEEIERETSEAVRQDRVELSAYSQQKAMAEIRANLGDYVLVHLKGSAIFFFMPTGGIVARALGWVRTGTGLQANFMTRGLAETLRSFRDFRDQLQISSGDLLFFVTMGYEMAYLLMLNAGAVWGGIKCLRARRWDLLLLTVVTIGYFSLITGPLSYDARYRMPAVPFLALLAAVAFSRVHLKARPDIT
jgi:4-amino-4-deoxy-L-arabinose transferase-like glycosyltransferase